MGPNKNDFLISEYSSLNSYVITIWTIMYTILSGVVVLYGYIVMQMYEQKSDNMVYLLCIMLVLIPTVSALVFGQLMSASYFFYFRIVQISEELSVCDAWRIWKKAQNNVGNSLIRSIGLTHNSGSFPFLLILSFGAVTAPIFIYYRFKYFHFPLFGLFIILAAIIVLINWLVIYYSLAPKVLHSRIKGYYASNVIKDSPSKQPGSNSSAIHSI